MKSISGDDLVEQARKRYLGMGRVGFYEEQLKGKRLIDKASLRSTMITIRDQSEWSRGWNMAIKEILGDEDE